VLAQLAIVQPALEAVLGQVVLEAKRFEEVLIDDVRPVETIASTMLLFTMSTTPS
jgi:hypothetical protein